MCYIYIISDTTYNREKGITERLYTVGTNDRGFWEPESDHDDADKAAERVAWLNGSRQLTNIERAAPELLLALKDLYLVVYGGNSVSITDAINRSVKNDVFEQRIIAAIKLAES